MQQYAKCEVLSISKQENQMENSMKLIYIRYINAPHLFSFSFYISIYFTHLVSIKIDYYYLTSVKNNKFLFISNKNKKKVIFFPVTSITGRCIGLNIHSWMLNNFVRGGIHRTEMSRNVIVGIKTIPLNMHIIYVHDHKITSLSVWWSQIATWSTQFIYVLLIFVSTSCWESIIFFGYLVFVEQNRYAQATVNWIACESTNN